MRGSVGSSVVGRRAIAFVLGILFMAVWTFPARAAADHIVILLPGQSYVPGTGIVGTPDPVLLRASVRIRIVAVDSFGNTAEDYEGRLGGPHVLPSLPGQGPPVARRYGTSISAISAATSTPAGSLRISMGGGPFQVITLAPAANPVQVCQSIMNGVSALPIGSFENGPFLFGCEPSTSALGVRYTLFLDDGTPVRAVMNTRLASSGGSSIIIDPSYGSAPALHLGAPAPSLDPNTAAEYVERRPAAPNGADERFSRGVAVFEMAVTSFADVGQNKRISVNQGSGPGLPVQSTPFTILPSSLSVTGATAIGDGNGRINKVRIRFREWLDLSAGHSVSASDFTLSAPGSPPIPGTSLQITSDLDYGYEAASIEVTFGAGLGRTDITNVEVRYQAPPGGSLRGAESGTTLSSAQISSATQPPLVDGAPPVLVSTSALDTDGNGGLDLLKLIFSEDVAFSGARGLSISGLMPLTDTSSFSVTVPFELSLRSVGLTIDDQIVTVTDPHDPAATSITGADAIAEAITDAVRWDALHRPAYVNFTCTFTDGRYVLRAGVPVRYSGEIHVLPPSAPGQGPPPALRLGPANGGMERPGSGDALTALPDALLVVRSQSGANLLLGKTAADMTIVGGVISLSLTNVPNSGTAQPTFVWRDYGDLSFIMDRAPLPNSALGFNNAGLPPDFHPVTMLREASSSSSSSDLALTRTVTAGDVLLDGSPSVMPLNASSPEFPASFQWGQLFGPPRTIQQVAPGVATVRPTQAGSYGFELVVVDSTGPTDPPFNPYLNADGTLSRQLVLTVLPGPQRRTVVVLPGQSLEQGAVSVDEVVAGTAKVATEGSEYVVRVVTTDEFFNEVPAPAGAQVRLVTTDPDDVESPFQPFIGSTSTFVLTPSHAATLMIPEIDDEVLVAFEHGDVHRPYVVGRLWNAHPLPPLPGQHGVARFGWDPDPRAVRWNIYRTSLTALADLDGDGLPDLGYGTCATATDPDPTDNTYEDATMPSPGSGFMYGGTEVLVGSGAVQEAGLGRRSSPGLERPNLTPCP